MLSLLPTHTRARTMDNALENIKTIYNLISLIRILYEDMIDHCSYTQKQLKPEKNSGRREFQVMGSNPVQA